MVKLEYHSLLPFFKKQGLEAEIQKETNQIYALLKIENKEFPLFSRIFEQSGLLQLLVFLPCTIPSKQVADIGRLLHMFNKELDVPGFGMDETVGVAFFRCMVAFHKDEIPEAILDSYMATFKTVCHSFSPAVEALAAGVITFEELVKKASAAQNEAKKKEG